MLYLLDQQSQAAAAYRRVRSAIAQVKDTLIMVGIGWDTSVPNARLLDYFAPAATT